MLDQTIRSFLDQPGRDQFNIAVSLDHEPSFTDVKRVTDQISRDFRLSEPIPIILKPPETFQRFLHVDKLVDAHVKFAFELLASSSSEYGVLMEEDIDSSPDLLELFIEGGQALQRDKSLICVSGWNQNSVYPIAKDPSKLVRTDTMPTLGFMMKKTDIKMFLEAWPARLKWTWDWWIRGPPGGRECVSPELSRTHHIGSDGVHVKDNGPYERMAASKLPAGLGTFSGGLPSVDLDRYDTELKARLQGAVFVKSEIGLAMDYDPPANSKLWILTPREYGDRQRVLSPKLFAWNTFRMRHRGLIELRFYDRNSTVFLIDDKAGVEWIPEDMRYLLEPPNMRKVVADYGQSCAEACGAPEWDFPNRCAAEYFYHVNNFPALRKAFECNTCKLKDEQTVKNRGFAYFDASSGVCINTKVGGFDCSVKFSDSRLLCPCYA